MLCRQDGMILVSLEDDLLYSFAKPGFEAKCMVINVYIAKFMTIVNAR